MNVFWPHLAVKDGVPLNIYDPVLQSVPAPKSGRAMERVCPVSGYLSKREARRAVLVGR